MQPPDWSTLERHCAAAGLACRGGFAPEPDDGLPGGEDAASVSTVVLLGFAGRAQWPAFAASPEYRDGHAHPLDRWSRRVIDGLAAQLGATAVYPFTGPPWWPFQRWAQRAEGLTASPLGILIHPRFGLWHAYRGALLLRARLSLPPSPSQVSPCRACATKPCLSACPVGAVQAERFDHESCLRHVASAAGVQCREEGCRARLACPVGSEHRHTPEQSAFHMAAMLRARSSGA